MASKICPVAPPPQTFAFITHSPATLPNNLPPDVDDASLARRRRRRTSHKDQIVLEEEFARCDRPDKHKRKEIAARVGLEDKQVQIWFQNRRQTHRRKSKPLQPHELIPRNVPLSSDPIISPFASKDNDIIELPSHSSRPSSPCPIGDDLESHHTSDATEPDLSILTADTSISSIDSFVEPDLIRKTSPIHFLLNPATETPETSFHSFQSTIPDVEMANIDSNIDTTMMKPMDLGEVAKKTYVNPRRSGLTTQPVPSLLKRSSSAIRLSMSFDGKASVILDDEEDSLPRGSQTSQTSFHEHTPPKRRTDNAKIWESCCDTSLGAEPVKDDSPRKALKTIRARSVVAKAKAKAAAAAAADARTQKPEATEPTAKVSRKRKAETPLGPKSANPSVPDTGMASKKPLKMQHFSPAAPKADQPRKVVTKKGPKKATPSPKVSSGKKTRSPYRTLTESLNGKNGKPGFTIYQSDEGDSDKENWEPGYKVRRKHTGRDSPQPFWRNPTLPRLPLGDISPPVAPVRPASPPSALDLEREVVENLMSLRAGLWR
ncbi:hypothetical protein TWF730_004326 [Orbilia blumenaviensis]|uniref:Homeobox domain-containing protein n=1 Tax=Orbilia blumenaviensis TaxID=1796055 RepID=A0AAV9U1L0_9PEZI